MFDLHVLFYVGSLRKNLCKKLRKKLRESLSKNEFVNIPEAAGEHFAEISVLFLPLSDLFKEISRIHQIFQEAWIKELEERLLIPCLDVDVIRTHMKIFLLCLQHFKMPALK